MSFTHYLCNFVKCLVLCTYGCFYTFLRIGVIINPFIYGFGIIYSKVWDNFSTYYSSPLLLYLITFESEDLSYIYKYWCAFSLNRHRSVRFLRECDTGSQSVDPFWSRREWVCVYFYAFSTSDLVTNFTLCNLDWSTRGSPSSDLTYKCIIFWYVVTCTWEGEIYTYIYMACI